MNNKELEQIGESVWDTYKKLATCLVERGSESVAARRQRARKLRARIDADKTGNPDTESLT